MCGIAGLIDLEPDRSQDLSAIALRMGTAISHRGPDASHSWSDRSLGVGLSHQRLAVVDLSHAGCQPMHSSSGRFVIAFNGEIYNHRSLRRELSECGMAPKWRGLSDTETFLEVIEAFGLPAALQRSTGMWAFALVDRLDRRLYLARDRFGEKPLYWGFTGKGCRNALVFGSELAAIRAYPAFNNTIDRSALAELLRFGQVPSPLSIYAGIAKLPAGHFVSIPLTLDPYSPLPQTLPWWQLGDLIQAGYTDPLDSEAEALELLNHTLQQAVVDQSFADVPLGAFLSGGIDSTLVAALLQRHTSFPLRTFTIGFEECAFNEAPHARAVAAHLGTDHSETMLTSTDARALIPQLPQFYSEPFADSSQLPTYLVCREARCDGLTVALSGDGGDELFGGYNRYFLGPRILTRLALLPMPMRRRLGSAITRIHPSALDFLSGPFPVTQLGHKVHKFADRLKHVTNSDELYRSLLCGWLDPAHLLQGDFSRHGNATTAIDHPLPACLSGDPVARMMAWDALGYLPDDILVKVDRAAMAVGLETRAPFLDHRVAAVAWRLPMDMKIRSGTSKWALRQILYKYVPRHLIDRPKAGFAIPIGQWLRGPLRVWADELLNPDRLEQEGYLRAEPIHQIWQQHLSGRYDHTTKLWTVLMWQAWLEHWG